MKYLHCVTESSNLTAHLEAAVRIDEALRRAATPEALTIPAVDLGEWATISAPGRARLVEDLWLSRRTYSTIHFLMLHTSKATSPAGDFTEDAGVLMRRLLELLSQTSWLTDHEPPTDLDLPVAVGSPTDLEDLAREAPWPDEENRMMMLAYLAAAVDWIDVQALRADRAELTQQQKTAKTLAATASDEETTKRHADGLALLQARDRLTEARLQLIGAPTTARHDTTSLLARLGDHYALAYRYESDSSHGMAMGRLHQRGQGDDPMLGAPSPEWRREMVMATANAVMLELGSRVLGVLHGDTAELDAVADEHRDLVAPEYGDGRD